MYRVSTSSSIQNSKSKIQNRMGFRNTNEVWGYVLAEVLYRLGLRTAVICPGSRSTPLAIAFAVHPHIEAISVLDERSAAFWALGRSLSTGIPTVVVCTSGTAGANFYPAVIEAFESRVPLLLLTADRPPELRFCHSGQTVDQVKLFANYPNWYAELNVPGVTALDLAYLRQTLIYAWERCLFPSGGVVHLNIPLRDPLAPIGDGVDLSGVESILNEDFFAHVREAGVEINSSQRQVNTEHYLAEWQKYQRGLIIAGVGRAELGSAELERSHFQEQSSQDYCRDYCQAIASLSQILNFPVLAEGLSPVRNHAGLFPNLVSTYDSILRNPELAGQLVPDVVIQIGELPTSKVLRAWLQENQPRTWVIEPSHHNLDALHNQTTHLRVNVENLMGSIISQRKPDNYNQNNPPSDYYQKWQLWQDKTQQKLDKVLAETEELFAGKAAWILSQVLPPQTPIFIANSMAVRDVEFFWKPNDLAICPFFNRGANGIDGTLSTALGIAHRQQSSILLTGDLALLHDTNGFLTQPYLHGHLTIILINNNGGGIFDMLPVSQFDPPFSEFFITPQNIDFSQLCQTYGVDYKLIKSWSDLQTKLNPLPTSGIRVLELQTNRQFDVNWRRENLGKMTN